METEKRKKFIINVTYTLFLLIIVYILLKYGLTMLMPFVMGFFVAYMLQCPISVLSRVLGIRKKAVAIIVVTGFYGIIGVLLVFLGSKAVSGLQSLFRNLPQIYTVHIEPMITGIFSQLEVFAFQTDRSLFTLISELDTQFVQSAGKQVSDLSIRTMSTVSGVAAALPGAFIRLVLMIIATFFIAADYEKLTGFCLNQLSENAKAIFLQIKEYVIGTLFVCIRSYALIITITFTELFLGLTLLGIEYAALIAGVIAIFDILPVLGTGGIMIPWAIIAALLGKYSLALGLVLLYVAITVIRNIIEPKIVGSQLNLHPVVTLASMFAGVQLFGVIGLFGFPIVLSLLRYLNDNGTIHILK